MENENYEQELITIARELDKNGSIVLLKRFYYKNSRKQKDKDIRFQECVFIDSNHKHFLEFIVGLFPQEIKEIRPHTFRLKYMSKGAINFLNKLLPFLRKKKRQAELVLEYSKLKRTGGYRISDEIKAQRLSIYKQLQSEKKNLKHKGETKELLKDSSLTDHDNRFGNFQIDPFKII